jgi:hypothetical protein
MMQAQRRPRAREVGLISGELSSSLRTALLDAEMIVRRDDHVASALSVDKVLVLDNCAMISRSRQTP